MAEYRQRLQVDLEQLTVELGRGSLELKGILLRCEFLNERLVRTHCIASDENSYIWKMLKGSSYTPCSDWPSIWSRRLEKKCWAKKSAVSRLIVQFGKLHLKLSISKSLKL